MVTSVPDTCFLLWILCTNSVHLVWWLGLQSLWITHMRCMENIWVQLKPYRSKRCYPATNSNNPITKWLYSPETAFGLVSVTWMLCYLLLLRSAYKSLNNKKKDKVFYYVDQASLLPEPECWDFRHIPWQPSCLEINERAINISPTPVTRP